MASATAVEMPFLNLMNFAIALSPVVDNSVFGRGNLADPFLTETRHSACSFQAGRKTLDDGQFSEIRHPF